MRNLAWAACLSASLILFGCVEDGTEPQNNTDETALGACGTDEPRVLVMKTLRFSREEGGVTNGLDLDGLDSDNQDPQGCFQPDSTNPDGESGVDNQFGKLLPGIEAVGGEAIEGLAQGAINQGELLFLLELGGMDHLRNDDCVNVTLSRGMGVPIVGTDGLIESGQTFDINPEVAQNVIEGASLVDGRVKAGPFDMSMPFRIFEFDLLLNIRGATLVFDTKLDGTVEGFISGALNVQEIITLTNSIDGGGGQVADLVQQVVASAADLAPDEAGVCQQISVSLSFETTTAFIFPENQP